MSDEAKEAVRKKIEDDLIELRDARVSLLGEPHGLVVRERYGKPSPVIRIGLRSVIDEVWQAATTRAREEALGDAEAIASRVEAKYRLRGRGEHGQGGEIAAEEILDEIRAMKGGA